MTKQTDLKWVLIQEVNHPDEAQLIGGLLQLAAIPVRIDRESAADLFGLSVGPLGLIRIYVPSVHQAAAERIIAGNHPVAEETDQP